MSQLLSRLLTQNHAASARDVSLRLAKSKMTRSLAKKFVRIIDRRGVVARANVILPLLRPKRMDEDLHLAATGTIVRRSLSTSTTWVVKFPAMVDVASHPVIATHPVTTTHPVKTTSVAAPLTRLARATATCLSSGSLQIPTSRRSMTTVVDGEVDTEAAATFQATSQHLADPRDLNS